jgi:hypothetical protein
VKILISLFLPIVCSAQVWVQKPVPHWTCPDTHGTPNRVPDRNETLQETDNPNFLPTCLPTPGRAAAHLAYNIQTQEKIFWKFSQRIAPGGELRISWPGGFLKTPGCDISGDEKKHIRIDEADIDFLVIRGTPGQSLSFSCNGLIERKNENQ